MITEDADIALVLRAYAAYARGDIDAAVADMHADVAWVEPDEFPDGGARHGPAEVADYLRRSHARWSDLVSEPSASRRGDRIVVLHHMHGHLLDGTAVDDTVADVYTVRDGQVVAMQAYADPAQVGTE